jgi:hypothetical protein
MKRSLFLAAVVGLGLAFLPTAKADSVWDVTGSFTLVGNNACQGPCAESASFSFDLQYIPLFGQNGPYQAEVTNFTAVGLGNLGSFTHSFAGPLFLAGLAEGGFIGFPMAGGITEMDLEIPGIVNNPTPKDPSWYLQPTLYSCGTATCVTDFGYPALPGTSVEYGIFLFTTATYSISQDQPISTPEPASLFMLGIGLAALAIWRWLGRESKCYFSRTPSSTE